jgi:uncharacterized protein
VLAAGLGGTRLLRYSPGPRRRIAKALIPKRFVPVRPQVAVAAGRRADGRPGDSPMSDFKLLVERIREKPESHRFVASAGWWRGRSTAPERDTVEVEAPFVFDLTAVRVGEDLLLEGTLSGEVLFECSRCAKRYPHALRDEFRLLLEPADKRGQAREPEDQEGARGLAENGLCLGEDLEAGWYRGAVIRLDDYLGEVIALAMPLQPLCRDDCPGICPHCGADRSETPCSCVDERIESPFAVLAKLREGAEGTKES